MRLHSALLFTIITVSATLVQRPAKRTKNAQVLVLGSGMAGVIAARTLHEHGIEDYIVVDAKTELGGRMVNVISFGATGKNYSVEMGPSWIQGTQTGNGPINPVYSLALKHNLSMSNNDWYGNITTYDYTGANNYLSVFHNAVSVYVNATVQAGERVNKQLIDTSLQSAYQMMNAVPKTPQEAASEYYQTDWTPARTSWIASSWRHNFTYSKAVGFSLNNSMSIDQRGMKFIVKAEAQEFMQPQQLLLNHTISSIEYDSDGVTVIIKNGTVLTADYALCTFSVGVLQHDDVVFSPKLPSWKVEAINSIDMAIETKIYLQFSEKFWFKTQMALYADKTRGRYPVWQSLDHGGFLHGSGIIFTTITGSESIRVNALNNTQVQVEVMEVLRAMFPNTAIPEPDAFHMARWNTNPIYRGAYSNWPPSFANGHVQNLRANVGKRLWFAGEATSLKYFGLLQGAYFEGQDVATVMAGCIKWGSCKGISHVEDVRNVQPYSV